MNVSKQVYDALTTLDYPVYQDESKPSENAPETYLTYKIVLEQPERAANNRPRALNSRVQVSMWSADPELTQGATLEVMAAMRDAGFLFINAGGLPFNNGRFGWRGDYRIYNRME